MVYYTIILQQIHLTFKLRYSHLDENSYEAKT